MSIEALFADAVAALKENTAILTRVVEGQTAALAKIAEGTAPKATRTPRAPKADEPAAEPSGAPQMTMDDLTEIATTWMKGLGETPPMSDQPARVEFLTKILPVHFGTAKLLKEEGIQDAEQRAQAAFFIRRKAAGLPVDFSEDYDFAGDPMQGARVAAADEVDPADALG